MSMKPICEDQGEGSVNDNPENDMVPVFHKMLTKYRKKKLPKRPVSTECRFRTGFDLALYTLLALAL